MNRTTSIYTMEVPVDNPVALVEQLVDACPVELNGSSVMSGRARLNFRAEDDAAAMRVVSAIAAVVHLADGDYQVHTGFGAHLRVIW